MNKGVEQKIIAAFSGNGLQNKNPVFHTEVLGGGLINHTYRITPEDHPSFLLQQINNHVFPAPHDMQDNYMHIWNYARQHIPGMMIPAPLLTDTGDALLVTDDGHYWRAFEFIQNTCSFPVAEKPDQAAATARTFAKFTASFGNFDVSQLKPVIPGFHDLSLRYRQFETALEQGNTERISKSADLIHALQQRERYKKFYESLQNKDDYPLRVMHHDAKIANILFSKADGKVVCPVDYDTVMPGHYFSDLGDMIRSMAACQDENSMDLQQLCIRRDFYTSIVEGYLELMREQLTAAEIRNIHYAGIIMIYMQTLRFLTDHLHNDSYYRITHPGHNYERAMNQYTLLEKLEQFLLHEYQFRA